MVAIPALWAFTALIIALLGVITFITIVFLAFYIGLFMVVRFLKGVVMFITGSYGK